MSWNEHVVRERLMGQRTAHAQSDTCRGDHGPFSGRIRFCDSTQFVDCKALMVTASFIIAVISEVDLRQYSIVPHRLRPTSKNGREHGLPPVDRRSGAAGPLLPAERPHRFEARGQR